MAVNAVYWVGAAIAAGSAYDSHQQGVSARDDAKKANAQNMANSEKTLKDSKEASNKINQKNVNGSALLSSNQMAAKGGQSGTMLTGPGGIDPSVLKLGKTTLLGGAM